MNMLPLSSLPTLNAILNATSAVLLLIGYRLIRQRRIRAHRACMLAAIGTSSLFLVSYLVYHYHHGTTRFPGQGMARIAYLVILTSHTILAATVLPLVLLTVARALRSDFPRHKKIARWALPIWLYVSVTGVIVYLMLYHLFPA
jgi:putative membrane protein